jgi:DNA-binding MarR family transcriptional regulator
VHANEPRDVASDAAATDAVTDAATGAAKFAAGVPGDRADARPDDRLDGRLDGQLDEGQLDDGLTATDAFDYAAKFTRRAVERVPALDSDSMLLFVLLARVARITSYDFEAAVHRPAGLNYSSFFLVALLAVNGPMEGTRLASASGMSRAAVSALAKTLERDGWLARGASPRDGRSVVLSLSADGAARIPQLFADLNAREQQWASQLSGDERAEFLRMLRLLLAGAPGDARSRS